MAFFLAYAKISLLVPLEIQRGKKLSRFIIFKIFNGMETEEKKLLQNTFNLAEENNKMLHKVRGVQKRHAIFSVLKIVIIIGIAVGAYYFLQPFVKSVLKFIQDSGASIDQLKNLGSMFQNMPR